MLVAMSAVETTRPRESLWADHSDPVPSAVPERALRRRPARGRPAVVDVLAATAGLGLGVTVGLAVIAESSGSLQAPGGVATAAGRLAGLVAAYKAPDGSRATLQIPADGGRGR